MLNIHISLSQMTAKKGHEEILKKALLALIPLTLEEPGCLAYELWEDLSNERSFTVYERFINNDALEAHIKMPYIQNFIANEYATCVESHLDLDYKTHK